MVCNGGKSRKSQCRTKLKNGSRISQNLEIFWDILIQTHRPKSWRTKGGLPSAFHARTWRCIQQRQQPPHLWIELEMSWRSAKKTRLWTMVGLNRCRKFLHFLHKDVKSRENTVQPCINTLSGMHFVQTKKNMTFGSQKQVSLENGLRHVRAGSNFWNKGSGILAEDAVDKHYESSIKYDQMWPDQQVCPREISSVAWRISRRRAQIDHGPGTSGKFNISSGSSGPTETNDANGANVAKACAGRTHSMQWSGKWGKFRKVHLQWARPSQVTSKSHRPVSVSGNVGQNYSKY